MDNLAKLFSKSLLAELFSEDTWLDRMRRAIETKVKPGWELTGPYTDPLWSSMSVVDDCILVDNRLAMPDKLGKAVLKQLHWPPGSRSDVRRVHVLMVAIYAWRQHEYG